MSLAERFNEAVSAIQNLPKNGDAKTSDEQKLEMYALFKQATVGPCNQEQPSMWHIVARYKWKAWKDLGTMSSETAMETYLQRVLSMCSALPSTPELDTFIKSISPPETSTSRSNLSSEHASGNGEGILSMRSAASAGNGLASAPLLTSTPKASRASKFQREHSSSESGSDVFCDSMTTPPRDEAEVQSLRSTVATLQRQIGQMSTRLEQLEGGQPPPRNFILRFIQEHPFLVALAWPVVLNLLFYLLWLRRRLRGRRR